MTAQAKPQSILGLAKTTLLAALKVLMIVWWVFLGLFVGIPLIKMVFNDWSRTVLWHEMSGKTVAAPPTPTPAPPSANAKGAK